MAKNAVDFSQAKPIDLSPKDQNEQVKAMRAAALNQQRAERKALRIDCLHLVIQGGLAKDEAGVATTDKAIREAKELIKFITGE